MCSLNSPTLVQFGLTTPTMCDLISGSDTQYLAGRQGCTIRNVKGGGGGGESKNSKKILVFKVGKKILHPGWL